MMKSGVPLIQSLEIIVNGQKNPKMDGSLSLLTSAAAGRIGPSALEVARSRDLSVTGSGQVRVMVESAGPRSRAVAAVQAVGGTVEAEYQDLVQALVALYKDNAATLTPDPLHSAFYDSHPPAALRIARLREARLSP
jgi:hypothetical protein